MKTRHRLAIAAIILRAASATGQASPPTPCVTDPNARRFDFWVGEWEVRVAAGAVVGHSVVERVSGQCALLENWTAAGGGTGKSLNAYNRQLNRWQQFWVGQGGGVTEYRNSEWKGDTLVFTTEPVSAAPLQRLSFVARPDGTVRQFGETSNNAGRTWTTQYEFFYHRRT
jgi:hypothetical protein